MEYHDQLTSKESSGRGKQVIALIRCLLGNRKAGLIGPNEDVRIDAANKDIGARNSQVMIEVVIREITGEVEHTYIYPQCKADYELSPNREIEEEVREASQE